MLIYVITLDRPVNQLMFGDFEIIGRSVLFLPYAFSKIYLQPCQSVACMSVVYLILFLMEYFVKFDLCEKINMCLICHHIILIYSGVKKFINLYLVFSNIIFLLLLKMVIILAIELQVE